MTEATISGIFALGAQSAPTAQPTIEQAMRFQELLQQTDVSGVQAASYETPRAPAITIDSQLQPIGDFAADISHQLRENLQQPPLDIDPELWPELDALQRTTQQLQEMNLTTLQLQFFGKGVQLLNDSMQALYQRV